MNNQESKSKPADSKQRSGKGLSVQRLVSRSMNAGDRVICIDDTGWLIPDPGFEHLSPKKGETYTVREYLRQGGVGVISVVGGHPDHFYRACRFKKLLG